MEENNNYNLIDKEEPIIKNICYDNETGNILLTYFSFLIKLLIIKKILFYYK